MKSIESCRVKGCGLRVGYEIDGGQSICWLHAEQQKLPVHVEWRREFAAFLMTADSRAATKRDNYGVLGHA